MRKHSKRDDQVLMVQIILFLVVFYGMWFGGHALSASFLWLGIAVVAGLKMLKLIFKRHTTDWELEAKLTEEVKEGDIKFED